MNKATKIYTLNDIIIIDFNSANSHQIENYGISFDHCAEKFQSKKLVANFKICKMVIQFEIH